MNIDFHLYGTYAAALIAGCNNNEAKKIAFSAQMVDDFTEAISPNGFTATSNKEIIQTDFDALVKNSDKNIEKVVNLCGSWMVFHFIPGIIIPELTPETITDRSSLYCALGGSALNYLINDDKSPIYGESLVSLGIGCHMYADVYAHMCFSGLITRKPVVVKNVSLIEDPDKKGIKLPDYLEHLPFASTYVLPGGIFMGHGLAGHYPDISTAKLKYTWDNSGKLVEFTKDNTEYFAIAFSELIRIIQKRRAIYSSDVIANNEDVTKWYKLIVKYLKKKRSINLTKPIKDRYIMENDTPFKELLENSILKDYCIQEGIEYKNYEIATPVKFLEEYELYKNDVKKGTEDKNIFETNAKVIKSVMLEKITNPETKLPIDIKAMIKAEFK